MSLSSLPEPTSEAADCYFLAPLAGMAQEDPSLIRNSVVDLGDGTYAVEFYKSGTPEFFRVNNQFPDGGFVDGLAYAHPGTDNTIWAMVMEKAFCDFRSGKNTYASISWGNAAEPYTDLNQTLTTTKPVTFSDAILYLRLAIDLANHEAVRLCTPGGAPQPVGSHCYTLLSVGDVNNVLEFTVRNPWGTSGDWLEKRPGHRHADLRAADGELQLHGRRHLIERTQNRPGRDDWMPAHDKGRHPAHRDRDSKRCDRCRYERPVRSRGPADLRVTRILF